MEIVYPDVEAVIETNKVVLREIKVLKADRHEILIGGREKIRKVLESVEHNNGDVYDKAAVLLCGLIQAHAFASGNRRTAYDLRGDIEPIMQGIREDFYTHEEIVNWLKGGEIHEFER